MKTSTIADLLGSHPTMSFEFFPPKTPSGMTALRTAIRELEILKPDFVSVTYGATGSSREHTIEATRFIQQETTVATMGHLTCVGQTKTDIVSTLDSYAQAGVKHILALRGDPEGGPTAPWQTHENGLNNASELVKLIKDKGDFCVGVAAFPDAHPENRDFMLDAKILLDKQNAGAEFAITQLFFRAQAYFDLVERVRSLGCTLPIIAGIMPVTDIKQVQRFAELSGAELPKPMVQRLQAAPDPSSVTEIGVQLATELCQELLAAGVPGLHFFTQNRSNATKQILTTLQPES